MSILDCQIPERNKNSALQETICGDWDLGERDKHVSRKFSGLGNELAQEVILAILAIYSCGGGAHGKSVMENHAETSVKIEADALIKKNARSGCPN